ncbi:MAG TPA: Hsp33 family molecular chaperone HslO, partial [Rubrivivax sp.]|nr:Hsp33 family molecular chaperone HslO [Rubrivivax sp.]
MSELHKFLFDGMPVRGMLVRLDDDWQQVLARRAEADAWPPEVAALVGQMCAAGVLMQSNIKFDGALVLPNGNVVAWGLITDPTWLGQGHVALWDGADWYSIDGGVRAAT